MPGTKAYPMIEVARHTTSSDCWMVIDSKIYDVTTFMSEHPGGDDILVDSSGRDATREFEDVGHSGDARAQLDDLLVGDLRDPTPEEEEAAAEEARLRGESMTKGGQGGVFAALAKWLLPIMLVGVAFVLRKFTK